MNISPPNTFFKHIAQLHVLFEVTRSHPIAYAENLQCGTMWCREPAMHMVQCALFMWSKRVHDWCARLHSLAANLKAHWIQQCQTDIRSSAGTLGSFWDHSFVLLIKLRVKPSIYLHYCLHGGAMCQTRRPSLASPYIWNALPKEMTSASSPSKFCQRVKALLLRKSHPLSIHN